MASGSADFNYKVALASGLKGLQGGRLRQAEEQFRYLVRHFPAAEGGYRGLAKVLVEQEDRPGALRVLLDGGAALAKAGERTSAIALYREAVTLDTADLAAHRRLAAALTLAGQTNDAVHEHVRYIKSALAAQDTERAKREAAHALERFPDDPAIAEIASAAGASAPEAAAAAPVSTDERDAFMRSAFGGTPEPAPAGPESTPAPSAWQPNDAWETTAPARAPAPAPGGPEPIAAELDAMAVEATAARYIAAHDPRGGQHAIEAARRYIADGRMDAASDLLLQLVATGIADHDAQRLLVEVTKNLGRKDVAKAKVQLLVEALRLDGRAELAAEVEQLAQAF